MCLQPTQQPWGPLKLTSTFGGQSPTRPFRPSSKGSPPTGLGGTLSRYVVLSWSHTTQFATIGPQTANWWWLPQILWIADQMKTASWMHGEGAFTWGQCHFIIPEICERKQDLFRSSNYAARNSAQNQNGIPGWGWLGCLNKIDFVSVLLKF